MCAMLEDASPPPRKCAVSLPPTACDSQLPSVAQKPFTPSSTPRTFWLTEAAIDESRTVSSRSCSRRCRRPREAAASLCSSAPAASSTDPAAPLTSTEFSLSQSSRTVIGGRTGGGPPGGMGGEGGGEGEMALGSIGTVGGGAGGLPGLGGGDGGGGGAGGTGGGGGEFQKSLPRL
jgi:hypothetical protein